MKKHKAGFLIILLVVVFFSRTALAASKCSVKSESNNDGGIAITVKSKMDYAIQGTVKVKFYIDGKKYKTKTRKFVCTKAFMFDIDPFGDWATYYEGCTYKVSVSDVKKSSKKNAASKIDVSIKRKNHKSEDTADIIATLVNTSKKTIKYTAFLAMRYNGKDIFGEDRTGQYYHYVKVSGTLKPGKKKTLKGTTWYDYKIKSKVYLDAYYK